MSLLLAERVALQEQQGLSDSCCADDATCCNGEISAEGSFQGLLSVANVAVESALCEFDLPDCDGDISRVIGEWLVGIDRADCASAFTSHSDQGFARALPGHGPAGDVLTINLHSEAVIGADILNMVPASSVLVQGIKNGNFAGSKNNSWSQHTQVDQGCASQSPEHGSDLGSRGAIGEDRVVSTDKAGKYPR